MAVFFLYVGLEIKAEFKDCALFGPQAGNAPLCCRHRRNGRSGASQSYGCRFDPVLSSGWAISAATDIAFAVGVVGLLGARVSPALKAFLLAVAVIDDLGAILIIAFFYTAELLMGPLVFAGICLALLLAMNLYGVSRFAPYLLIGLILWYFVLRSGINPTLAGLPQRCSSRCAQAAARCCMSLSQP